MKIRSKVGAGLAIAVASMGTLNAGVSDALPASLPGSWTPVGTEGAPNINQTETLLKDGRVLVTGGDAGPYGSTRADIFDPKTTTWSQAASLTKGRSQATANLLDSGRVLVAGGTPTTYQDGQPVPEAETYNPVTDRWKTVGRMLTPRFDAMSVKLKSGKPLICGGVVYVGDSLRSCEIYHPKTQRFTYTGSMVNTRRYSEMVRLRNGNVLAVGDGVDPEVYSVKTHTWSLAAKTPNYDTQGTATLMDDGTVVVTPSYYDGPEPTEVYHPAKNVWTTTGDLEVRRYSATVKLKNGDLMTTGGCARGCSEQNVADADIYDAQTGQWHAIESMTYGREIHSAVALRDGRVLVVGGGNIPEIYTF